MNHFNSIRELLNTLNRGHKLLAEMFEKRKSLSYKYEYALEVMEGNEDVIQLLISKSIIRQSGTLLELDDQFLKFFEEILEVNEEINTSYINESIRQVKDEYMLYYLQATTDSERFKYLKAVKSALRKIGRITMRSLVDLNRNIENAFKTEPNYKIKLSKLENHKLKLVAIQQMIEQTEKLLNEDELTFFKTATDEELKYIRTQLILDLTESRQNLIETRKQIIEYINQIKYQSKFIEKLRQLKYLRDQFEIKYKTNIIEVLTNTHSLAFEAKPFYSLKLSLENLQQDEVYQLIKKVSSNYKSGINPLKQSAENLSDDDMKSKTEKEIHINLREVKRNFAASGKHLFDYISEYQFPREVSFAERVTIYCQMISIFEDEFEVSETFERYNQIEYAIVYPK
jgi:predicted DNA-binding transcriptional regulator AlpA